MILKYFVTVNILDIILLLEDTVFEKPAVHICRNYSANLVTVRANYAS